MDAFAPLPESQLLEIYHHSTAFMDLEKIKFNTWDCLNMYWRAKRKKKKRGYLEIRNSKNKFQTPTDRKLKKEMLWKPSDRKKLCNEMDTWRDPAILDL